LEIFMTAPKHSALPSDDLKERLLPCPFCGSADIDPAFWMCDDHACGPGCSDCGATADTSEAWNWRANDARIEALEAQLAEAKKIIEPFAALGGPNDGIRPAFHDLANDVVVYHNSGRCITAGDIRAARGALGWLHAPWPIPPDFTEEDCDRAFAALPKDPSVSGS
jgi:hypothetical protein